MKYLESLVYAVSAVIICGILVFGYVYVQQMKADRMSTDLRMAADKGIDPLSIRCAWADSTDTICLIHTSRQKSIPVAIQ